MRKTLLAIALMSAPFLNAQQSQQTAAPTQQQQYASPAPSARMPRVFLDSKSKGSNLNVGRDQSMEMSKDFERDCPSVKITILQTAADYTVLLNHIEVGLLIRDNQLQVANRDGDVISNVKSGSSIAIGVKKSCDAIMADWNSKPQQ
jgi:hypothetical protein